MCGLVDRMTPNGSVGRKSMALFFLTSGCLLIRCRFTLMQVVGRYPIVAIYWAGAYPGVSGPAGFFCEPRRNRERTESQRDKAYH